MLTPVDIENKEFSRVFRGFDTYEVEEFMRTLVTDYEKLYRENGELKEKNILLTEAISKYESMEEQLQSAILVAQQTAEQVKQNAYERAETIVKDAERRAAEAVDQANHSIRNLEKAYLTMQQEMNSFKAKMSALLTTYMKLLEDLPEGGQAKVFVPASAPVAAPAPKEEPAAAVTEDTVTFVMPESAMPKKAEAQPAAEEAPKAQPAVFEEPERKVNPIVEELLRKKQEACAAEAAEEAEGEDSPVFSVKKETIQKDEETGETSIDVKDLKDYDVFSDEEI